MSLCLREVLFVGLKDYSCFCVKSLFVCFVSVKESFGVLGL